MYQNYIFDLYGTLIDIRTDEWNQEPWDEFAKWLNERGLPYTGEEVREVYSNEVTRLSAEPTEFEHREIDILPAFGTIMRKYKSDVTDEEIWEAGEKFRVITTYMIRLYPNSKKVLTELRKAGKKVFLLSNAQRVFTWQELERTGITEDFDDIFISSDKGCKKPDKAFYKSLIDKHNLAIEDCVMIGNDSTTDIAGAKALGMDGFYVRTEISPENDPAPDCRFVFEDGDIGHVLELIEGYGNV